MDNYLSLRDMAIEHGHMWQMLYCIALQRLVNFFLLLFPIPELRCLRGLGLLMAAVTLHQP